MRFNWRGFLRITLEKLIQISQQIKAGSLKWSDPAFYVQLEQYSILDNSETLQSKLT